MRRNKPRLQLALYARPKDPGTYHWAIVISPKSSSAVKGRTAIKHHVKNTLTQNTSGEVEQPWRYERTVIQDVRLENRLLVRVVIAKITAPVESLEKAISAVPVYQKDDRDPTKAQSFTCRTWVRAAVETLRNERAVSGLGEWEDIQRRAVDYVEMKQKSGRWSTDGARGRDSDVPMFDLMDGREIVR